MRRASRYSCVESGVDLTCIVGIVDKGIVSIGGDSAGVAGYSLTVRKDAKVFSTGDYLIGGTTSFRMLQLLHYAFVPPVYEQGTNLERFMATTFVDAVRDCLKSGGYAQKSSEQESGGTFLVGCYGHLFCVYDNYQVAESASNYDACGCGSDVALGALYATSLSRMSPEKRLIVALRAAQVHNAAVREPFVIAHQ